MVWGWVIVGRIAFFPFWGHSITVYQKSLFHVISRLEYGRYVPRVYPEMYRVGNSQLQRFAARIRPVVVGISGRP